MIIYRIILSSIIVLTYLNTKVKWHISKLILNTLYKFVYQSHMYFKYLFN